MLNKDYNKARKCAKRILDSYGQGNIDGKDAEDFASESYQEMGRFSGFNIRCRIIDAVRKKLGRSGAKSINKPRSFVTIPNNLSYKPEDTPLSVDELANSFDLDERNKKIVTLLALGLTKTEVAKEMGVSPARIGQIVKDQIIPAYKKALNTKWS